MKNKGQDTGAIGHIEPANSAINCAVPNRSCLDGTDIAKTSSNIQPRIIHEHRCSDKTSLLQVITRKIKEEKN